MRDKRLNLAQEALETLATTGHAVALELCDDLETRLGLEAGNRAVKRAFMVDLPSLGWAYKATPKVYGNLKLTLLRIDWGGVKQLRGRRAVVNEWERMNTEHEGERYERHTLGVLALAWQARRRGHQVKLLPGRMRGYTQVHTWVEPDLKISYPGVYGSWVPVEFETRPRGKMRKWAKWKQNHSFGVCTFSEKQRESLGRELERAGVRQRAWMMSLEALMKDAAVNIFENR